MAGRHVHLVGSMNLPSAETAISMAASQLGDALLRLPDGEPGPRRGWVFYQRPMFTHHQQLVPDESTGGTPDVMSRRRVRPPVPIERHDDAYFAPLADLDLGPETELFLGLVHHGDGVAGAQRRMAAAAPHVPEFGIATECGIGRVHDTAEIAELFQIHAELAAAQSD
jgi:hypothetical protein